MESRLRRFLLNRSTPLALLCVLLCAPGAQAEDMDEVVDPLNPASEEPLIEPEVERRDVRRDLIDSENIEFGVYAGLLSIEDFGSAPVVGGMLAWHFTEDLFLQTHVYSSEAGLSSYEVLSGGTRLLTSSERELFAYDLAVGYNVFPGEAFIGRDRAFNTAFYVLGGIGSTQFGGEDRLTLNIGVGYRLLINDWAAWHIGYRDHVFASDITGEDKDTHNIELQTGFTTFF
jgi:outer membrane beta-barrel protein